MRQPNPAKSLRLSLALAAAAALALSPPAEGQGRADLRRLLVAVKPSSAGLVSLEVIAFVTPDGFAEVPAGELQTDSATQVVARRFFARGIRYPTFSGGRLIGVAVVQEAEEAGCAGVGARAAFASEGRSIGWNWRGVGLTGMQPLASPVQRIATKAEQRVLREVARGVFRRKHVGQAVAARMVSRGEFSVSTPGQSSPVLAGAYEVSAPVGSDDRFLSQVLVVRTGAGRPQVLYSWYGDRPEEGLVRPRIWGVADIDGDGVPEIVTRMEYYESWNYGILRHAGAKWEEVFRGGGGGC